MTTIVPVWVWLAFHLVVFGVLALDLGVLTRKTNQKVSVGRALVWSAVWVLVSLAFCGLIRSFYGGAKAMEFATGYVVEYALSVDNIFVFILVFGYFNVPERLQHGVLLWGVLSALVMRGCLIFAGSALMHHFDWLVYPFGLFLVFTGLKLVWGHDTGVDPDKNRAVGLLRRVMPMTSRYEEGRFFVRVDGRRHATPLLAVLLAIESTDLIFAVDSIPAVLAISHDFFIVYTSNICAILGLRSLYFALAGIMGRFHYLPYGLAAVLSFVGAKMILSHTRWDIPLLASLLVIVTVLTIAVIASLLRPANDAARPIE